MKSELLIPDHLTEFLAQTNLSLGEYVADCYLPAVISVEKGNSLDAGVIRIQKADPVVRPG